VARTQAVYYRDIRGVEPVNRFIEALPPKRAAKIDDYVEEHLNGKPPDAPPPEYPITSQIEGGLRELRVRFANTRYRILYQRSGNLIVLLHALEKATEAVPDADIELAGVRMADFRRRMDVERRMPPRAAGKDAPSKSRKGVASLSKWISLVPWTPKPATASVRKERLPPWRRVGVHVAARNIGKPATSTPRSARCARGTGSPPTSANGATSSI